jgi:UDP-N-acetylmuramate--alanine ligase
MAHLRSEFARSFNQADVLVLTEIYPAGEEPIPGVSGRALFEDVKQFGHKDVHFEPDLKKIPGSLLKIVRPGDIVIFLGAGNITKAVPEFIQKLEPVR